MLIPFTLTHWRINAAAVEAEHFLDPELNIDRGDPVAVPVRRAGDTILVRVFCPIFRKPVLEFLTVFQRP